MKKLIFPVLLLSTLLSCKKEGCTDLDATNYNVDAKKDNGTCTYEGSVIFWRTQATSQYMVNAGVTDFTFYMDGQMFGSETAGTYWTSSPECDANGVIKYTYDLGSNKTQSGSYEVKDQTNQVVWSGVVNFNANNCLALELGL